MRVRRVSDGALMIVAMTPVFDHAVYVVQAGADVTAQDPGMEGPVEAPAYSFIQT